MIRERTVARDEASSGVHLAEVVGSIAVASDLGLGQPLEHVLRSCVIATRVADHLDLAQEDRDATYWVTLFMAAGCTGVSFDLSSLFGDDIAFRAGVFSVPPTNLDFIRYLLRRAGGDGNLLHRTKVRANLLRSGMSSLYLSFLAHCAVSAELARQLDLGDAVVESLLQTFEQWNGKGMPNELRGEAVRLPIRISNLASLVEVHDRQGGLDATLQAARAGHGTIGPDLVAVWCEIAAEALAAVDAESSWQQVVALQPRRRGVLTNAELDAALELMGDYADLKSPWLTGHSRGVASLAVAAGHELGLPDGQLVTLRRAALIHDIGRNGVPNSIWDKPSTLTDAEYERVRLHAYYTDRVLHRAGRLALLASIASAAHERHDGSGYPRAVGSGAVPILARLLAAADVYQALVEDRPHRPAWTRVAAGGELRRAARDGELDPAVVDALLVAAGHPVRRQPAAPAGLTPREVEVLALAARGMTTKRIGAALGITPKTAGNHIERIYQKIGVSTRAEAAMFAMRHGLVPVWDTDGLRRTPHDRPSTSCDGHRMTTTTSEQGYVDLDGVRTYYEITGTGEPLVLLHGGMCTIDTFSGLASELAPSFLVHRPERRGHGRTADVPGPITYENMAADTAAFIEARGIAPRRLERRRRRRPDRGADPSRPRAQPRLHRQRADLEGLPTETRPMLEDMSVAMLPPFLREMYAVSSPDGSEHFDVVWEKVAETIKALPYIDMSELQHLRAPTLVLAGDQDMITIEHADAIRNAIPDAQLAILPGTHALPMDNPALVARLTVEFIAEVAARREHAETG